MEMPALETERLVVRPFTMDDLPHVHLFQNARRRAEWLRWTVDSYEQLARLWQPPYGDRAVALRDTGEIVGVVGYVPSWGPWHLLPSWRQTGDPGATLNSPEMGLHYNVKPSFQGRGYATEAVQGLIDYAFETLELRRIVATTEHENERSQAVMRRVGMTVEQNPHPEPPWFQVVGVRENTGR